MIQPRRKEVYRYMGFKHGIKPDELIRQRVETCIGQLQKVSMPRSVFRKFPLIHHEDGHLETAGIHLYSNSLMKNLEGCDSVYLFAATIGIEADRLIARSQIVRMSDAVIYQAAAAEMIEIYCDEINQSLKLEEAKYEKHLRPRFSPGYGDLPLDLQKDLIRILDTPKQIGLTLTDSMLMMPSKSVTAIIGVTEFPERCHVQGCEACNKTDCDYRRSLL